MSKVKAILLSLLLPLSAAAQEQDTISNGQSKGKFQEFMDEFRLVQQYLDSSAKAKVDSRYITIPEKPWRVIIRDRVNTVDVDYSSRIVAPKEEDGYMNWNMCFSPPRGASLGAWVGYRGMGFGFAKSLSKNAGRFISVSTTGAKFGFNFRYRKFETTSASFSAQSYSEGEEENWEEEINILQPAVIRSFYVNGYYVLNNRRYSQAAAYNLATIQRRSAGSFLLGATWYSSSFDYAGKDNSGIMLMGGNTGRMQLQQVNICVGYGFNIVPFRNFVINLMAMPNMSIYNRVKVTKYDSNFKLFGSDDEIDDYGKWNSATRTWENGKTHKPFTLIIEGEENWAAEAELWKIGYETEYSAFQFNLDLRAGMSYNFSDFCIGFQMQFNNYFYKKDYNKVELTDGYAMLSIGVRL